MQKKKFAKSKSNSNLVLLLRVSVTTKLSIWASTNDRVAKAMMDNLSSETVINRDGEEEQQESFNSIYMMADSGTRGSQLRFVS
ncbi:hypothetical protein O9992_08175 [Vibrio lentus]|nr:hypothetical protein [Vibrio lentus]